MIVLPIIRNIGDLKKSGRNDPPKLAETTQGRNDQGRNNQGQTNPGPKRLRAEMTLGRNDPERFVPYYTYIYPN